MLIGNEIPETENPAPVTDTFEIVRALEPELEMVIACESVTPIPADPKFTLVGETEIAGCPALAPVPVSAIVETAGLVLAVIEMLPVTVPAAVGVNLAVKAVLCPAGTVIGSVNPATEKPVPVATSCVMVSVALPVFATVNVCVLDAPMATLPNDPVAPATATVVAAVGSDPLALVNPVQPI
jgi:hypothetical protein